MISTYKNQTVYISHISADHKYVLATVDSNKQVGFFKIDMDSLGDHKFLAELKQRAPIHAPVPVQQPMPDTCSIDDPDCEMCSG